MFLVRRAPLAPDSHTSVTTEETLAWKERPVAIGRCQAFNGNAQLLAASCQSHTSQGRTRQGLTRGRALVQRGTTGDVCPLQRPCVAPEAGPLLLPTALLCSPSRQSPQRGSHGAPAR